MAKWGKCDYKQLKNLQKKIEKLNKVDMKKFDEKMIKELAARMLAKVIKKTHVGEYPAETGKKGGTLRRGWTSSSEKEAMYGALFNASNASVPKLMEDINVTKQGDLYEIEIVNTVSYASYVEYGHRTRDHKGWVNGRFMMTISEQELEADAPGIIEKKLTKYLQEVFNGDKP